MAKKLRLSMDDLAVESFDTGHEDVFRRGTVHGHALSDSTCVERICRCSDESGYDVSCGTCNARGETCDPGCETYLNCYTNVNYPGC
ncbi:MAG TPA: hypothetical protein VFT45_08695 [Longimicrobium sp.]|nr:hypothetical protein [Longimicrobium sp.]